jgi:hypothetical protein
MLLGIVLAIQYGWLFLNAQKVTNTARQGLANHSAARRR